MQNVTKARLLEQSSFWHFTSYLKIKNRLGRVSSSHFLENVLIKGFNIFFQNF